MKLSKAKLGIWIGLGVAIIITLGISLYLILSEGNISDNNFKTILLEVDKALITTTFVGVIANIISENMLTVARNNKKLKEYGIENITAERLSRHDVKLMFGTKAAGYPYELKFMFISGNRFTDDRFSEIAEAIKHGCHLKMLIANPSEDEHYLDSTEKLSGQKTPYREQIAFTRGKLMELNKLAKENNWSGKVTLKYFKNEYRYNIRISAYDNGKGSSLIRCWTNYTPISQSPNSLSLCVFGSFDEEKSFQEGVNNEHSIITETSNSFDKIWDLYPEEDLG